MTTDTPQPNAPPVHSADEEVSAKERVGWLKSNITIWLLALLLLIIAVVGASFAFGLFTSSAANANNTFTAGSLQATSDPEGAIFTATNMLPGDEKTGSVTIENSGESSGVFTLSTSNLSDVPGQFGGNLSEALQVAITQDGTEIYNGAINATISENLGEWSGGESHVFNFVVTFPDTGVPTQNDNGDNLYQNSSMTIDFNWVATQSS